MVLGGCLKVLVRRQPGQVVAEAELDEEGVDSFREHRIFPQRLAF